MEFSKDLLDFVSVPRFAVEALLQKSESSIRVYLYGLVRGSAEAEQMAGELGLSRAQVLEALEQLEAAGLLRVQAGGGKVQYLLQSAAPAPEADPYTDREFN